MRTDVRAAASLAVGDEGARQARVLRDEFLQARRDFLRQHGPKDGFDCRFSLQRFDAGFRRLVAEAVEGGDLFLEAALARHGGKCNPQRSCCIGASEINPALSYSHEVTKEGSKLRTARAFTRQME